MGIIWLGRLVGISMGGEECGGVGRGVEMRQGRD